MTTPEHFDPGMPSLRIAPARRAAQYGLLSALLFWISLAIFGSLQPGYSHVRDAVSLLGAVGATHQWAWNWLGFILPGVLLVGFGAHIAGALSPYGDVTGVFLVLCGILFAATGVFPANLQNTDSFATRMHVLASVLSLFAWLPGSLFFAADARRVGDKVLTVIALCATLLVVMSATFGRNVLPSGVGQRLTFATFYFWVVLVCLRLWWNAATHSRMALQQPAT